MKTLQYIDSETFESSEVQYDDFHYHIAEDILNKIKEEQYSCTSIMANKDATELIIGIMRKREPGGEIAQKYRIKIEKIVE